MNVTQKDLELRVAESDPKDQLDVTTASARRAICDSCDKKTTKLGLDACGACGCFLLFKTALRYSKCPENKWIVPDKIG
jgi:hypothetical protein